MISNYRPGEQKGGTASTSRDPMGEDHLSHPGHQHIFRPSQEINGGVACIKCQKAPGVVFHSSAHRSQVVEDVRVVNPTQIFEKSSNSALRFGGAEYNGLYGTP